MDAYDAKHKKNLTGLDAWAREFPDLPAIHPDSFDSFDFAKSSEYENATVIYGSKPTKEKAMYTLEKAAYILSLLNVEYIYDDDYPDMDGDYMFEIGFKGHIEPEQFKERIKNLNATQVNFERLFNEV